MAIQVRIKGKTYTEISFTEYEAIRLQQEITRQLTTGRVTRTKHDVFLTPADHRDGKKTPR